MADEEESLGILQFAVILLVTVLFGGVLIAIVLFIGGKRQEKDESNESKVETKVEELKNGDAVDSGKNATKKVSAKNSKRVNATSDHPKQLCILKGHTSDVLCIEFTSNGKLLGSTSSGRVCHVAVKV